MAKQNDNAVKENIMKTVVNVSIKVIALLLAAYGCLLIRNFLFPLGFTTPNEAESVFRYAALIISSLGLFSVMMIVAEFSVRWILGESIVDIVKNPTKVNRRANTK